MRTFVVYRAQSEHATTVETFMHDFTKQTGKIIDTVDPDTPDGVHLMATYDIVELPSVVAIDDGGAMQNLWRGLPLPTISEVSYYAQ